MNKELFSMRPRRIRPKMPTKACSGKIKLSEREAKAEARNSNQRHLRIGTPVLSAYKCPFCHFWHVGTSTKKRRFLDIDWTTL